MSLFIPTRYTFCLASLGLSWSFSLSLYQKGNVPWVAVLNVELS
jgi:hypothetical protein